MQTLVCLGLSPPYSKRISPWLKTRLNPHFTAFQTFSDPLHIPSSTTRSTELHDGAKGFGAEVTLLDKKRRQEKDAPNNSSTADDDEDAIPQAVFNRMMVRILFSVGIPMIMGLALLYIFSTLKEQHIWDVPLWLPYVTILLGFGTSSLGMAYGTLSTSWDPDSNGSLLGWEEAQKNWPEIWKEEEKERV